MIYEAGSSTIGRAISAVRPLLAVRGFAVPDRPGIRLRTDQGQGTRIVGHLDPGRASRPVGTP
ncbi:hypothetical protein [Streptomyces achromogenes]|uniref:hypothetical protein n=1 Tax=Streptomyces achromogenes TaxID=67255 RepID=UPI0037003D2B